MKKIFIIMTLASAIILSGCSGHKQSKMMGIMSVFEINNLSADGLALKGNVKSVKTSTYKVKIEDGEVQKGELAERDVMTPYETDPNAVVVKDFNEEGQIIAIRKYNTEMTLLSETKFSWQGDNLLNQDNYLCDYQYEVGNPDIVKKETSINTEYKYDGDALTESVCNNDNYITKTSYTTDSDGSVLGFVRSSDNYDTINYCVNTYQSGRIVKKEEFGTMTATVDYNYSDDDVIEETTTIKLLSDLYDMKKGIYQNGLLTSCVAGWTREIGAPVEELIDGLTLGFTYNDSKDLMKIVYTSEGKSSECTFEYEYDDNSNWIKRISYIDSQPRYIEERTIDYYK